VATQYPEALPASQHAGHRRFSHCLAGVGRAILGRELPRVGGYLSLSAPAAIGFLLLFSSALAAQKDKNWIHVFTAPRTPHVIIRRLLYIMVGMPVALAMVISAAQPWLGGQPTQFGLFSASLSIGLATAVVYFGKRLVQAESSRKHAVEYRKEAADSLGR
jgi:hypothetical protein